MELLERYQRNIQAFSQKEMTEVHKKSAVVVGCGGLGGHVLNSLARFGISALTMIDGDVFDVSNLNRQLFCYEDSLGESKAVYTKKQIARINSQIQLTAIFGYLTKENARVLLEGHDVVFDCLDFIDTRLLVEKICNELCIPLIHGAIAGFLGQVAVVFPGDDTLLKIYGKTPRKKGIEEKVGNPSFIPQVVGGIQASEGLQLLAGRESKLRHHLLYMDLSTYSFDRIPIP